MRFSPASFVLLTILTVTPAMPALAARGGFTASPGYADALRELEQGQSTTANIMLARGGDPVLNKVLKAQMMAQPGNGYSFDEMADFVSENPDWPGLKGIKMILEQKIPQGAAPQQIVNWFNAYPPLTQAGFMRYIECLNQIGQGNVAATQVRQRWIEKDFSASEAAAFRSRFAGTITQDDDELRLDRLVWDGNSSGARAMFPYVGSGWQALAEARLALAAQSSSANALLAQVPSSLRNNAGLLYERMRWRRKSGDDDGAIEILMNAPEDLGRPDSWWQERHIIVRRLMEQKDWRNAYRLVQRHGLTTGFNYVQAEFTAGWLALRFLNKPTVAESHFRALLNDATAPVSRARGLYWLGRALEAEGKPRDAQQTYESASTLNTTFYGQLAIARLYDNPVIRAASEPPIPESVRQRFFGRASVQAAEKLYRMGMTDKARAFFRAIADAATQRVEFAMLLELAYHMQRPDWAVAAAKAANQKGFILTAAAYPVLAMRLPSQPDPAFTHALIRQESEFRADAGSGVGARGLMQLMPGTAKDEAQKLGLPYSPARLTDPDYNVQLGTSFIQRQIDNFNGSYILALAGYNAGPRRVREWMETYGDPRTSSVDTIDWLELIPIYETRNYVQRIMENLQFYRARLNGGQAPLKIIEDLKL